MLRKTIEGVAGAQKSGGSDMDKDHGQVLALPSHQSEVGAAHVCGHPSETSSS